MISNNMNVNFNSIRNDDTTRIKNNIFLAKPLSIIKKIVDTLSYIYEIILSKININTYLVSVSRKFAQKIGKNNECIIEFYVIEKEVFAIEVLRSGEKDEWIAKTKKIMEKIIEQENDLKECSDRWSKVIIKNHPNEDKKNMFKFLVATALFPEQGMRDLKEKFNKINERLSSLQEKTDVEYIDWITQNLPYDVRNLYKQTKRSTEPYPEQI